MSDRANLIIQRWNRLKTDRGMWLGHWDDLARVMLTRRLGFVSDVQPGDQRLDNIFDGTAMQLAQGLANAIGGMVRPEGRSWLFIKTADEADERTDEAKDWLADSEDRVRVALDDPRSRFRQATGEVDLDLVILGTAIMWIGEVIGRRRLLFQSVHLGDGIPIFDETGNVEGVFRSRKLTVQQAVDRWGVEKLSEETQQKFNNKKIDEKIDILFAVLPRKGGQPDALIARNLPIMDLVIEVDPKHEIEEGGFAELPYIVPRWDTTSGEVYGRSPGMIALPDTNTAQAIGETMLVAGQRAADPPLMAPSDAFIDAPNTYPGGLASYEADAVRDLGSRPIFPLETGANFPLTREIQNDTRDQIAGAFLRHILRLPTGGPQMTATEVIQRNEEFIREIGPVFGRIEADYTAPMIERVFNILLRAGALAPIPDVLSGRSVRFEYESPVRRVREQSLAISARQWAMELAEFEQIRPGALDNVNFDELARFSAEALALPHEIVVGREAVEKIRAQRAETERAQAEMAAVQQIAATAKDVGSTIKDISQPERAQ